jgi:Zn-dependent protease
MTSLLLATLFTFTVLRKVALAEQGRVSPFWNKAVALISILLWSGVGVGGRWIGFS